MKWSVVADARELMPSIDNRVVLFGHRGRASRRPVLDDASAVARFMASSGEASREAVYVLCLSPQRRLLGLFIASLGGISGAAYDPVPTMQVALLLGASMIVMVHNHPSGDPSPSAEDVALTDRLRAAGRELGVELVDHVIVSFDPGRDEMLSFSFVDAGLLKERR